MTDGNFPKRLKETMTAKGLTGRELAAAAGTSEATVSRYLSGARTPEGIDVLAGAAKALGVSSDYLLGLTNNPFEKGTLPKEVKALLVLYLRASDADRKTLWTILEKYEEE